MLTPVMFQTLIGTVKTAYAISIARYAWEVFQTLIGTVKTTWVCPWGRLGVPSFKPS